jgi:hypothetical protein
MSALKYPKLMEPWNLEPHYSEHVGAMTTEELHSKHDIAKQLAWRDQQLEVANARIIELQAEVAIERSGCDTALEHLEQHTAMNGQLIEAFDNLVGELRVARGDVEDLEQLVADACPLGWVASVDLDGARAWEVRAADLLTKGVKLLSLAPLGLSK